LNSLDALPEFTFRRVALSGIWDKEHSILIGPKTRDNVIGYHLLTPLKRPSGSTIIVDRGFVSNEMATAAKAGVDDGGFVEVVGMLRTQPQKNSFTPDNNPEKGEWYWADVDAVAEYAGGDKANVQPVLVEEIFGLQLLEQAFLRKDLTDSLFSDGHIGKALHNIKHGIPVGRAPTIELRNEHRTYAVTW
jgi:surfeit locus 1 family protein